MNPTATAFKGVFLVESVRSSDERGGFERIFCEDEFSRHGLNSRWAQFSTASNRKKGTLRGMHWQTPPFAETKLISCSRGRLWDCLVDLREDSETFGRWQAFELSEDSAKMLYVPVGIAHGYQTLEDDTRLHYLISEPYSADHARGLNWADPALLIDWPLPVTSISERDRNLPAWDRACYERGGTR